jgi:hypothetical protein
MGMPIQTSITGTGTFVWFPDWTLTPFQLSIQLSSAGDVGTASLDVTLDKIDISGTGGGQGAVGLGLGTTVANANWISVLAASSTANSLTNYTTAVQALRVVFNASTATSVMNVRIVQAGWPS